MIWPLPFILWPVPLAVPFWLIYLWVRQGERKVLRRGDADSPDDRGSWRLIDYGSKACRVAAVLAAFSTPPWAEGAMRLLIYLVGLTLMLAGALLRRHCFTMLGDAFTFQIKVSSGQPIVRRGAYRWLRHPSYTGGLLYNIGIGLALTNLISVLLMAIGMAIVYVWRVHVEENALLKIHGREYGDYMRQTKRFVPFVF